MIAHGMKQSCVDASLYFKNDLTVLVYTDDLLSTYDDNAAGTSAYTEFVDMLKDKFELGDDGHQDCTNFIGMHFEWSDDRTACAVVKGGIIVNCIPFLVL